MKKSVIILFVLFVSIGMIYSANLTVNQPSGGTWYKGTTHNITWTATGCSSTSYKINIFRGSIDESNFVEQLTKTGTPTKSWTIPMGYTNGTYYIRIKTDPAQPGCQGDSAAFTITDPSCAPSITVTNPTGSSQWCRGQSSNITWTSSGSLNANVKINIFKNSINQANFVQQLTATTASGSKSWAIPASAATGTYFVRIKEAVGTVYGDSPGFQVKDCGTTPSGPSCSSFVVYKPAKDDVKWIGFPMVVKWKYKKLMFPGTLKSKKVLLAQKAHLAVKPVLEASLVKMVKIEIKSVKCFSIGQLVPRLREMYVKKKVSLEKINTLMKIPFLVEMLKWKTLKAMTPDDGSELVIIPSSYKKGCYVIRVTKLWCTSSDSDRRATSEKFSLIPLQIPGYLVEAL